MKSWRTAVVVFACVLVLSALIWPTVAFGLMGAALALGAAGIAQGNGGKLKKELLPQDRAFQLINRASIRRELQAKIRSASGGDWGEPRDIVEFSRATSDLRDDSIVEKSHPLKQIKGVLYDHWLAVFAALVGLVIATIKWNEVGDQLGELNFWVQSLIDKLWSNSKEVTE